MAIFGLFCWQGARSPRPRTVQYHQIYVFNGSKPKMAIKILFVDIQPVDTQAFRPVNNCDVIFKQHIPKTIDLEIIAKQQKKQETNNLARVAVITSKGKRMIRKIIPPVDWWWNCRICVVFVVVESIDWIWNKTNAIDIHERECMWEWLVVSASSVTEDLTF